VQPVGQLDHEDARIARHRDDHLADRLRLRRLAELDLVELRDAVHEMGHVVAEVGVDGVQAQSGVLDRVVQEGGYQGRGVHPELGHDHGHR
jgi:hypothetical protein